MNKTPSLFFGSLSTAIDPQIINNKTFSYDVYKNIIFQHQVHGNTGLQITKNNLAQLATCLVKNSDYLITDLPGISLGILTADCMPIAFHDPINKAIGIIHAGWRGTTQEIVINAAKHMNHAFGTLPENLLVFFGPSAQPCCYCVKNDFIENIPHKNFLTTIVTKRDDKIFIDLPTYNQLLLKSIGVQTKNISRSFIDCTICNHNFVSYRRDRGPTLRQISIITL
jgi:YfiH family protein